MIKKIPKRKEFLVFGNPLIEEDEIKEVERVLRSGWVGTGPLVAKFEEDFKKYVDMKYAVAVNSCTAALHLSLLALNLPAGSEVITTPMTFCATANAIIHANCIPVFADCKKDSLNIDPGEIEKKVTKKTRAILPVHFAGRACEMDEIKNIAKKNNLAIIEDCAHAIETKYKGKHAGSFGELGCFSFYVTKNVVTGEGGMVVTNNDEFANKIKILALHGMSKDAWKRFSDEGYKHYQVVESGYKYNMMDIQAAMGIHQLKRVNENWKKRKNIWEKYNKSFIDLPCFVPKDFEKDTVHGLHLYTLLLDIENLKINRDFVLNELTKMNIGSGVHYIALNLHPFYQQKFGYKKGDFNNAEWVSERTISLPISAKLNDEDVNDVIASIRYLLEKYKK